MIPIQPIGPGAPRIERPSKGNRVRRAPKRSREEPDTGALADDEEAEENESEGDDEQPRIDLRA